MFILVGGVPGSGKTTITSEIVNAGQKMGLSICRVKGSDLMCQLAGVNNVDELRSLPEEYRSSLRPEMYRLMYKQDKEDPSTIRVRDMHFSLRDGNGIFVPLPVQDADREQLAMMVLLNPKPDLLLDRRMKDSAHRSDRAMCLDDVHKEIRFEMETALNNSRTVGVPICILDNETTPINTANLVLREFVRSRTFEGQNRYGKETYL